jgi:hypothetical protein
MAKYDPLREYLRKNGSKRITMTFEQVSRLVEREGRGGLPRSAYEHQAWWGNEGGSTTIVQKIAWNAAGYRVASVDHRAKRVTFERQ